MKKLSAFAALGMTSAMAVVASPAVAQLSISISANFAPPGIPVYDQPPIPGPDYIWMPGYWAWDDYAQDYFWIPATWVLAPRAGLLWTPPWWGWQGGAYLFHAGYWGPHVGFYGGIAYGFGYTGSGYQGAYWNGPHLFYNRSVTNVTNVHVTNVYNKTVVENRVTRISYNGGPGGIQARPSPAEQAAMHEPHVAPTPVQQQHFQSARANRQLFSSANHGRPPIAASPRPAQLGGQGIVPTRQAAPYHAPPAAAHADAGQQPSDTPPHGSASPPAVRQPKDQPEHSSSQDMAKAPGGFPLDRTPQHGEGKDERHNSNGMDDALRAHQDRPDENAAQQRAAGEMHAPPPERPAPDMSHQPPHQQRPQGGGGHPAARPAAHPKPPQHKDDHQRG